MTCVQLNVETKGTRHFVRTGCIDQCHHKENSSINQDCPARLVYL